MSGLGKFINQNRIEIKLAEMANSLRECSGSLQAFTEAPCCQQCLAQASFILGSLEAIRSELNQVSTLVLSEAADGKVM